jgi:hypothetical protein
MIFLALLRGVRTVPGRPCVICCIGTAVPLEKLTILTPSVSSNRYLPFVDGLWATRLPEPGFASAYRSMSPIAVNRSSNWLRGPACSVRTSLPLFNRDPARTRTICRKWRVQAGQGVSVAGRSTRRRGREPPTAARSPKVSVAVIRHPRYFTGPVISGS